MVNAVSNDGVLVRMAVDTGDMCSFNDGDQERNRETEKEVLREGTCTLLGIEGVKY